MNMGKMKSPAKSESLPVRALAKCHLKNRSFAISKANPDKKNGFNIRSLPFIFQFNCSEHSMPLALRLQSLNFVHIPKLRNFLLKNDCVEF